MTSLPPPKTNMFPENSIEKKVYNIVETFSKYLPAANDRNRLGFSLYKYIKGEGDIPEVLLKSAKVRVEGITPDELAQKISVEIEKVKKSL
jgi:hypothetical protein